MVGCFPVGEAEDETYSECGSGPSEGRTTRDFHAAVGALLKSLAELKLGSSLTDVLGSIRLWRKWISRAGELKLAIPDPLVLKKVSEALSKLGGNQVTCRISGCSLKNSSGPKAWSVSCEGAGRGGGTVLA